MKRLPRRLEHGEEATLVEHLGELRTRMVIGILALVAGFTVAFVFHGHLLEWLNRPLPEDHQKPLTFGPAEPFLTSVTVSLFAGFLLAMPVLLWQLWSFLAPAFHEKTQRTVAGLVAFATALGAGGVAFGYFVALPAAVKFLSSYDQAHYNIQIRAKDYYSFTSTVLVAVAVVFEVPIVILGLVRIGVLTPKTLRRRRRLGYVIMAAIAVALPGIDPVTTTLEMLPLMLLFEGSIWLAVVMDKRWKLEKHARLAEEV